MTPIERFKESMVIDYVKWHDGDGYDLEIIRNATAEERSEIQTILLRHGIQDWRDVEALAELKLPPAEAALKAALLSGDSKIRVAIMEHAPHLVDEGPRAQMLVRLLNSSNKDDALAAIDQAAEFHPPDVVDALLRGALHRSDEVPVNFAGLLKYIFGKTDSPFDWDQRPFFLRFHTPGPDRDAAFRELCQEIGVDPSRYF